jgi:putative endonuclease
MPQTNRRHILGRYGEEVAANYLQKLGYELVERNFQSRSGEIDIILRHEDSWVFVEVKTRNSHNHAAGLEAVDYTKLARMRRAMADWLHARGVTAGKIRMEVVSVLVQGGGVTFDHVRQVV